MLQVCDIDTPVETQAVRVQAGNKEYIVVNMYVPGEVMKKQSDWIGLLNPLLSLGPRVLISGDYNARSPQWLDKDVNTNGKSLEEALPQIPGIILNNDRPTRYAERAGDSDSCIDITIVSPQAAHLGGARPGRATTSNLETVVHNIQQAMQELKHTAVGLFDLEDAYN